MARFQLQVNGKTHAVEAEPQASLLSVLRDQLDLTGSKYGCGEGQCGLCTVLIEGEPQRSCITRVGAAAGRQITTIEGIERDGQLHPLAWQSRRAAGSCGVAAHWRRPVYPFARCRSCRMACP